METLIILSIGVGAVMICGGLVAYMKILKKRLKKYVIRYKRIKKYFEDDGK